MSSGQLFSGVAEIGSCGGLISHVIMWVQPPPPLLFNIRSTLPPYSLRSTLPP